MAAIRFESDCTIKLAPDGFSQTLLAIALAGTLDRYTRKRPLGHAYETSCADNREGTRRVERGYAPARVDLLWGGGVTPPYPMAVALPVAGGQSAGG